MERKKKSRAIEQRAFTKIYEKLNTDIQKEVPDKADIQANLLLLEKRAIEIDKLDKAIFNLMLDSNLSDEEYDEETTSADEYQRKYEKMKIDVQNVLTPTVEDPMQDELDEERQSEMSVRSRNSSTRTIRNFHRKFKLPEIELKKFDGNIKEWLQFWGQFRKIHEDEELAAEDKFQYLIQATVDGSRAHEYVTSFPPTENNYSKAVEGLKTRFGREDLLIEVYVRELLTLVLKKTINKNEMIPLCSLYDKLECHLRALESLGVTTEKYAAMLFPLVESSMPEDLLRTWQRTGTLFVEESSEEAEDNSISKRLKNLMLFIRSEVQNEERIKLAASGFNITSETRERKKKIQFTNEKDIPTAASLVNIKEEKKGKTCIFCDKKHSSTECFKANKISLEDKRKIVNDKKCCFRCLRMNHIARNCHAFIKCTICEGRHVVLMCPKLPVHQKPEIPQKQNQEVDKNLTNFSTNPEVFLQTLVVKLKCQSESYLVRAMIDTGSQKSYILEDTTRKMKFSSQGTERLIHSLFGGVETVQQEHKRYKIAVKSIDDKYSCNLEVLSQKVIVNDVSHIRNGLWMKELQEKGIKLTDIGKIRGPIQLLLGADVAGTLFTSRQIQLPCGMVALETKLGWTLMGRVPKENNKIRQCTATTIISMLVTDAKICDLWELDTLGIKDPVETKLKHEKDLEVQQRFLENIRINKEGRYEIKLPWIGGKPEVPSNYEVAERRLHSLTKKLKSEDNFEGYNQVLEEWRSEGIIEEVNAPDRTQGHYLPHRHVIKENSTTRIRPVFNASFKTKSNASLNECLEVGPNLVELIPDILLRFRLNELGVIADIKRAFLQISISDVDRDYLKFLWWDKYGNIKVYRHARVVFGVSSSPFLLAAVINYHLNKTLDGLNDIKHSDTVISKETVVKLLNSFYVDNCVASLSNQKELEQFIRESKTVMANARFDLRGWEYTSDNNKLSETSMVLGLKWNKYTDNLEINVDSLKTVDTEHVTKRLILSVSHKLFDPIGFICPITIFPKLLLQKTWKSSLGWETEVEEETKTKFQSWFRELYDLVKIKIPRWLIGKRTQNANVSVHTFCDASQVAYAAAIFLRVEDEDGVNVQLIQAKSRIAPMKQITIPRLELLAATVGARLTAKVLKQLNVTESTRIIFWTDSTTVLTWIKRNEKWEVFVKNRVQEIRQLTRIEDWRHVPGDYNPADLPSRGCSVRQLLEKKWWEGPCWLQLHPDEWPGSQMENNEEEVVGEMKTCTATINASVDSSWYYKYFSDYEKIVRLVAWIVRFITNCKNPKQDRNNANLSLQEITNAENKVFKLIQKEYFTSENMKNLKSLNTIRDHNDIIRVKTQITLRNDTENFRYPIVLPDQHPVVKSLIMYRHKKMKHAGVQILLNHLREDFWITRGRRSVRKVLKQCSVCKRHEAKNIEPLPCSLPVDRIRDARIFEIVGVDYAGPLHLRRNVKAWICLFTCAVYRAIHLELVTSLTTENFIQALRRFIARRGRPTTIYSDNGTNFVGTHNLLSSLDWHKIEEFTTVSRIEWKLNPPAAAWWGGWWERLIRIVKNLLKRVLGKSCITYEEMLTLLTECEAIINSRPITYMMDGDHTVSAITPNMFLHELVEVGVPDLDNIDTESLKKRVRYLQKLRYDLRQRFRNEYLGCLTQKHKCIKNPPELKLGEIVLIGNDNKKRIDWPLAKVLTLYPGKDGQCRLVKLQTSKGEVLRPIQRLYQLELCGMSEKDGIEEPLKTRSGRLIKLPKRYSN